jgi:hypothetical protein
VNREFYKKHPQKNNDSRLDPGRGVYVIGALRIHRIYESARDEA